MFFLNLLAMCKTFGEWKVIKFLCEMFWEHQQNVFTCIISSETSYDFESPKSKRFLLFQSVSCHFDKLGSKFKNKFYGLRHETHLLPLQELTQQQKIHFVEKNAVEIILMISNLFGLEAKEFGRPNATHTWNVTRMLNASDTLINLEDDSSSPSNISLLKSLKSIRNKSNSLRLRLRQCLN